jgi:hypothetical protein
MEAVVVERRQMPASAPARAHWAAPGPVAICGCKCDRPGAILCVRLGRIRARRDFRLRLSLLRLLQ